eukprot:11761950-Ditylum_brightwellii.AAC.1
MTAALEKAKDANNGEGFQIYTETQLGHVSRPPQRLGMATTASTQAKFGYQAQLCELAMLEFAKEDFKLNYEIGAVGAGLCGGFDSTLELNAAKYKEVMAVDRNGWAIAVDD